MRVQTNTQSVYCYGAGFICEYLKFLTCSVSLTVTRWEIIRAMPFNWSVVSGARGCRWGAYVLYFPLRALVALSFAFGIIGIFPPQWQPKSVSGTTLYAIHSSDMHNTGPQFALYWGGNDCRSRISIGRYLTKNVLGHEHGCAAAGLSHSHYRHVCRHVAAARTKS